uniref:Olfactory receptor 143 n=1 Tax=Aulacocentrum confusum TaxID=2767324 RepID=A0A7G8Z9G2_9HYME|nr:olfactory receptor 143 [Aulacocentrum confusum]
MVYHVTFIFMQYWDLINVFGNLESMILNLMETTLQTIIIIRVLMTKFNNRVLKVLIDIQLNDDFYKTIEEKKIRIHYYLIGLSFNRILLRCVSISAIAWYSTPFVNFIIISRKLI